MVVRLILRADCHFLGQTASLRCPCLTAGRRREGGTGGRRWEGRREGDMEGGREGGEVEMVGWGAGTRKRGRNRRRKGNKGK